MAKKFICLLIVSGREKALDRFKLLAESSPPHYPGDREILAPAQPISFHSLVPVPKEQLARRYTQRSKPGVLDSGRDWELRHWGCPRGAIQSSIWHSSGQLMYMMTTNLAPPTPLVRAASELFPKLHFNCLTIESRFGTTLEDQFCAGQPLSSPAPFRLAASSPKVPHNNRAKASSKWPKRPSKLRASSKR